MRIALLTLAASLASCGGTTGSDTAGPAGPPSDLYVAGSRLSVDVWTHGDLSLPFRLRDTRFDQPCRVESLGDATRCVPYVPGAPPMIGYTDASCSQLAVIRPDDADWGAGALVGFDDYPTGAAEGVYRVGEALTDGAVFFCYKGVESGSLGTGARYALDAMSDGEFVPFTRHSADSGGGLTVSWFDGADGAQAFEAVGAQAGPCLFVGDTCVPGSPDLVYPFQRAFADAECTVDAWYPQTTCGETGAIVALDECYQLVEVLGQGGAPVTGDSWRRARDGACVEDTPSGGWFGSCLQSLEPVTAAQALPLTPADRVDGDLTLSRLTTPNGVVVEAHFELPDGMVCAPAQTEDGLVRCVPQLAAEQAITPSGEGGAYVEGNVCDGEDYGPGLYTFFAGTPCSMQAVLDTQHDVPELVSLSAYVPLEGSAWEIGLNDDGNRECTELSGDGFWVTAEADPTGLPVLERQ